METLLVFISSTSDLAEEREELAKSLPLGFTPYLYERDRARRQTPRNRILAVLEQTDLFVGILGGEYGSVYPDAAEDRSIVEWEFDEANSRRIQLMPYRKELDPASVEPEQRKFLQRVSGFISGSWIRPFREVSDLVLKVVQDLAQLGVEVLLAQQARELAEDGDDSVFAARAQKVLASRDAGSLLARAAGEAQGDEPSSFVRDLGQALLEADDAALRQLGDEARRLDAARLDKQTFLQRLRWTALAAVALCFVVAVLQLLTTGLAVESLVSFCALMALVIAACFLMSKL